MIWIWIKSWYICWVHHIRVSTDRSRRDDLSGRSKVWGCLHRSKRYHRNTRQTAFAYQTIFSITCINYTFWKWSWKILPKRCQRKYLETTFVSGWLWIVLRQNQLKRRTAKATKKTGRFRPVAAATWWVRLGFGKSTTQSSGEWGDFDVFSDFRVGDVVFSMVFFW